MSCFSKTGSCVNSAVCNRDDHCMYDPKFGHNKYHEMTIIKAIEIVLLENGPATNSEIAKAIGRPNNSVRRAIMDRIERFVWSPIIIEHPVLLSSIKKPVFKIVSHGIPGISLIVYDLVK